MTEDKESNRPSAMATASEADGDAPFRLARYFALPGLAAILAVAAALVYFENKESEFFSQVQREQSAIFVQMQEAFARRQVESARDDLLKAQEAANVNLTRLFANTLWEADLAPLVAGAQRIPVDHCRTMTGAGDAAARNACDATVGRQIMALPGFRVLDAKVAGAMKKSTVFKIKVYDMRGITVYSSEHGQIGENKSGNAGWKSAAAGKPASELTHRDRFSAFEGVVENRDLISSYLPVSVQGAEKVIGVFEIYADVTPFLAQINAVAAQIAGLNAVNRAQVERTATDNQRRVDERARLLIATVLALLAMLYAVLFVIVRSGQRIMDRHARERRQSDARLRLQGTALDATANAIVITDREGLVRWANPAFTTLTGYAVAEALGRNPRDLLRSGKHDPEFYRMMWQTILSGRVWHGDLINRRKDGSLYTEEMTITPLQDAGEITDFIAVKQDVTQRRQVEDTLKQLHGQRQALVDSVDGIVWEADARTFQFTYVSRQAEGLLGYPTERWISEPTFWRDHIHPEDRDWAVNYCLAATRDMKPHRFEYRFIAADGRAIWLNDIVSVIVENGKPVKLRGLMVDITERKQAEQALREAEARFRGLVEQSIAGIYIIQDGVFAYANPRFAEILGYGDADELIGRDPLSTVVEKDRGLVAEKLRQRLESESGGVNFSFSALRKDGSVVDIGVHGTRATYRGRDAVIGLMQDISEKKRAEEQIQNYVAQLENTFINAVSIATKLGEMRDPYTAGHERRVAEIAAAIGNELGFDARRREGLRVAGHLHDIGKITVPTEILVKPGRLNDLEYQLIRGHAQAGYEVLKDVDFPWPVAEIARQHHERLDGSGYPRGLKGEEILLEARILAVADVIEAMASHRPYRPGMGITKALAEIERGRGTLYDPAVAEACLRLFREKGYVIPA